jgi:hypothetical protein
MMIFARWIEHALDATVQSAHDADPRKHCRAAFLGDQDQCLRRNLPFGSSYSALGSLVM